MKEWLKFIIKINIGALSVLFLFFLKYQLVFSPNLNVAKKNIFVLQPNISKNTHFSPNIGEEINYKPLFEVEKPKKKNILTKQLIRKIIFENHNISDQLYQKICKQNLSRCEKLFFVDIFEKDKYSIGAMIIFLLKSLDTWTVYDIKSNLYIIKIIDDPTVSRRGLASHHSLTINISDIDNYEELWNIVSHEFAHILDLGVIKAQNGEKDEFFTEFGKSVFFKTDLSLQFYKISRLAENIIKSNASEKDFVSGYSKTDPFEDFAETMNVYLNHNLYFKQITQINPVLMKKYKFFYELFDGNYFWEDEINYNKVKQNPIRRPRDSTLME